jgi:uncharacterized protein
MACSTPLEATMKVFTEETIRINVDRIPDEGITIKTEAPFDRFPGLKALCREDTVQFLSPIRMEVHVRWISHFVEAAGVLRTSVGLSCSRCLGDYSQLLDVAFRATYTRATENPDTPQQETDIELTPESIDFFQFHGREIDLTEAIQEQILLSLPLKPLCREACKGLCPRCGEDLNKGECGCGGQAVDPRLAVLAQLKLKK